MKTNKLLYVLLCISFLVFSVSSCAKKNTDKKEIAVIVKALDSDFWHSVKNGVESAATEYNISVTFEGPENEEDYVNQNKLIMSAVKRKANLLFRAFFDFGNFLSVTNYLFCIFWGLHHIFL